MISLAAALVLASAVTFEPPPYACPPLTSDKIFFVWYSDDAGCQAYNPRPCQPGIPMRFEASSFAYDPSCVKSFEWDFGDGTHATGRSATHVFPSVGYAYVTLIASNEAGKAATQQRIGIGIPSWPYPSFQATATGYVVRFKISGNGAHQQTRWNLDFGDATQWTEYGADPEHVVHTYRAAGNYRVVLTWSESYDRDEATITIPALSRSRGVRH